MSTNTFSLSNFRFKFLQHVISFFGSASVIVPALLLACSGVLLWIVGSISFISDLWVYTALVLQCVALGLIVLLVIRQRHAIIQTQPHQRLVIFLIVLLLLMYAIGIGLPETGFDALWYHLPITKSLLDVRHVVVIPELYQSVQPRLGSFLFLPWFFLWGTTGVKFFVWCVSVYLLILVYRLARVWVDRTPALLVVLAVASFHPIAWQASSAYVDQIRTVFELAALLCITVPARHRSQIMSIGMLLGASLLTKAIVVAFLPAWILYVLLRIGMRRTLIVMGIAMTGFLPVQLQGYALTGVWPVLSIFGNVGNELVVQGRGMTYLVPWILYQWRRLFILPVVLTLHREGYTTPLLLAAFPFMLTTLRRLVTQHMAELMFVITSSAMWLILVPLSTRYALTAFILLTVISVTLLWNEYPLRRVSRAVLIIAVCIGTLFHLSVRSYVLARAVPYLIGQESQTHYIERFTSDINRGPIEAWYGK